MTMRSGYVVLCCECCVSVMEDWEKEKERRSHRRVWYDIVGQDTCC